MKYLRVIPYTVGFIIYLIFVFSVVYAGYWTLAPKFIG